MADPYLLLETYSIDVDGHTQQFQIKEHRTSKAKLTEKKYDDAAQFNRDCELHQKMSQCKFIPTIEANFENLTLTFDMDLSKTNCLLNGDAARTRKEMVSFAIQLMIAAQCFHQNEVVLSQLLPMHCHIATHPEADDIKIMKITNMVAGTAMQNAQQCATSSKYSPLSEFECPLLSTLERIIWIFYWSANENDANVEDIAKYKEELLKKAEHDNVWPISAWSQFAKRPKSEQTVFNLCLLMLNEDDIDEFTFPLWAAYQQSTQTNIAISTQWQLGHKKATVAILLTVEHWLSYNRISTENANLLNAFIDARMQTLIHSCASGNFLEFSDLFQKWINMINETADSDSAQDEITGGMFL